MGHCFCGLALQCCSDVNKINVGESRHCATYEGIFILIFHYQKHLQIMPQIRGDGKVLGKVAWRGVLEFIVTAVSLGTIKVTLFWHALEQ